MPVIRNSVILRCSPEVAFDYLSDLRSELEWNPKCERMEKLTSGPPRTRHEVPGEMEGQPPTSSSTPWRSTGRAVGPCTTTVRSR